MATDVFPLASLSTQLEAHVEYTSGLESHGPHGLIVGGRFPEHYLGPLSRVLKQDPSALVEDCS